MCAAISGLPASAISSGTIATARLGSGTADGTTFLRGDGTWASSGSGLPAAAGTAAAPGYAFSGDTNTGMFGAAADQIGFSTNGTERIRVDASGKVGIGTTNPFATLDVANHTTTTNTAQFGNFGIQSFNDTNGFLSQNMYFNGTASIYRQSAPVALFQFGYPSAGDITFRTAATGTAGNAISFTDAITVKNTGNVGIGTTNPSAGLEVVGGLKLQTGSSGGLLFPALSAATHGIYSNPSANDIWLGPYYDAIFAPANSTGRFRPSNDNTSGLGASGQRWANLWVGTGNSSFAGNVGIGTTTPTAKLDVGGQTRSTNSAGATQANASAAVNWNNGNVQTMSVDCATTAFTNMLDSGTYVLAVSETGTSTCVFSQAGLTFFYSPANAARTSGQRTVYTFQRIGNDVYVSWVRGFQ
jgi:hypothetical protein